MFRQPDPIQLALLSKSGARELKHARFFRHGFLDGDRREGAVFLFNFTLPHLHC